MLRGRFVGAFWRLTGAARELTSRACGGPELARRFAADGRRHRPDPEAEPSDGPELDHQWLPARDPDRPNVRVTRAEFDRLLEESYTGNKTQPDAARAFWEGELYPEAELP